MINFRKKSSLVVAVVLRKGVVHFVGCPGGGSPRWYMLSISVLIIVGGCGLCTVSIDGAYGLPVK